MGKFNEKHKQSCKLTSIAEENIVVYGLCISLELLEVTVLAVFRLQLHCVKIHREIDELNELLFLLCRKQAV